MYAILIRSKRQQLHTSKFKPTRLIDRETTIKTETPHERKDGVMNDTLRFRGMGITCREFAFAGESVANGYQAYREIAVSGRPNRVTLVVTVDDMVCGFDLAPWAMRPGQDIKFEPAGQRYNLIVPVEWKDVGEGRMAPHTRQRGVDNVDVICRSEKGKFLDVQVALVTWRGRFYATAQQQYLGQVVRTTGPRPGTRALDIVALDPVNDFPGSMGFEGTWDRMGFLLKDMVGVDMPGQQRSRVETATWQEPKYKPGLGGWKSGVTLYYNLVTGSGRIMDATGNQYFVHAQAAVDVPQGGLPVLEPGKLCWFRLAEPEPGAAQAVKSVKPGIEQ